MAKKNMNMSPEKMKEMMKNCMEKMKKEMPAMAKMMENCDMSKCMEKMNSCCSPSEGKK